MAEIKEHWLNKKQMAASIGISTQAFDKWGVPSIAKVGRSAYFEVGDVIEVVKKRTTSTNDSGQSIDQLRIETAIENKRLKKEQADNLELKNDLLRAHSVPKDIAIFVLGKIAAQVVSILEQIPGKIKRRLPELTNPELDMVRKEIANCRNIASKCDQYVDDFIDEYISDAKESI